MAEFAAWLGRHRIQAACLLLATLLLLFLRALSLPLSEPRADQSQFLAYAYNMLQHGTFSAGGRDRPRPDQMREPGYPLMLAAGMLLHPGLDLDRDDADCVTRGDGGCLPAVTWLKLVNLLFVGLSALATFAALLALTGRAWLGWLGLFWVGLSAGYAQFAGSMFFAEGVVGFLIVAISLALWRIAGGRTSCRHWFAGGLLLGALVMTKATFYYLVPLLAVALAAHAAWRGTASKRQAAILGAVFLAGTLALTLPWHLRNLVSTGDTSLAGRAGLVLMARANYDALTPDEMLAAAALFSPSGSLPGRYLAGWLTVEREAKLDGPDNPRAQAFVRFDELRRQMRVAAYSPQLDAAMKAEAMGRIRELWPSHLQATLLFGYRGLFTERGLGFPRTDDGVTTLGQRTLGFDPGGWFLNRPLAASLALFLPAFAAFAFCLATGRWAYVFLMLPAAYLYGIQALMTHYIPRYSTALIPMLEVIALLSAWAVWSRVSASMSR